MNKCGIAVELPVENAIHEMHRDNGAEYGPLAAKTSLSFLLLKHEELL
jgi:hypothetical protein